MRFGCHLPVYGPAATRETLVGFARRAEAVGFDSLWASDHVVLPWRIASRYPYNATGDFPLPPATDFLEPLTALALVAGVTERVALGTTVLVLPHRHPLLAAKMLATLDHLAPGRVILGAGVGWMREEIEALGAPYDRRGAWSDEAIRVMRALRRVAELGDGWHAAFPTAAALKEGLEHLRTACAKAGRDPKTLTISARLGLPGKKPSAEILAEVKALRDLGVEHIILEPAARDLASMTAAIERFASDVRARLEL
ncbi:MAG: hypothetical protein DME02_13610 [Candidatus Rokuibacteriota bacterium]|nr:MAG: hypothetical protein DME02_13610 [Candidatus Rokubacteria bacterium]